MDERSVSFRKSELHETPVPQTRNHIPINKRFKHFNKKSLLKKYTMEIGKIQSFRLPIQSKTHTRNILINWYRIFKLILYVFNDAKFHADSFGILLIMSKTVVGLWLSGHSNVYVCMQNSVIPPIYVQWSYVRTCTCRRIIDNLFFRNEMKFVEPFYSCTCIR